MKTKESCLTVAGFGKHSGPVLPHVGNKHDHEYGYYDCHKINDESPNTGPDLSQVGSKLLESYMFNLI